jgi:hypothetical protein
MNLQQARQQLERSTGQKLPPLPQLSARHLERMKQLRDDHAMKIQTVREKADKRIADSAQHQSELIAESRLHKQLLREESMEERRQRDRVELAWRRGYRGFLEALGSKLGDSEKRALEDELIGETDDTVNPLVQRLSAWLRNVWTSEAIDVREVCDLRLSNGTASREGHWIEVSPLKNLRACLIALHETGHCCHPELADNREVLAEDKFHKISLPKEIAAWTWALEHTPVWEASMHEDMKRFIGSYRSYGIEPEIPQIDALCSSFNYHKVRLRIAAAASGERRTV